MNPKNLSIRMDRATGELWLTEEKFRKPPRRVANMTSHILLALCADLYEQDGTREVSREVKFADGSVARITVSDVPKEPTIDVRD